ncbi:hypothetical protein PV325_001716 [Microctonus aethiopoides]|uniref:ELYS-like domain-containing protein n=1 Tax=Microctonus aethiopoides TaxID=144406 RepID=A0AA39FWL4_9HYME|nr:hypothetical protein PV325_001716 [Microctonus aethiopoides]KAK0177013.1 hypothetical protein PV328_001105 [Microctonus aethiopoides]
MTGLEDNHCEVRKIVELQSTNWYYQNSLSDDDGKSVLESSKSKQLTNFIGGFLDDANYAWLSCGSKLIVFNTKTGVNISTWTFKDRVSCLSQFPAQPGEIPLLLVGLDNGANKIKESYGMVCIFDCTISQIIRAIRMPAGVEQLCIMNGGTGAEEMNDERMDNILVESCGMACIALKNLDHYVMDLKRDSWENMMNSPFTDELTPAEIDMGSFRNIFARNNSNRIRHTVHNLMNERLERYIGFNRNEIESSTLYQEKMTTSLICSRKIGCLISGCLGRIIIWQTDGTVKWISSPMGDDMTVSNFALLEPTDDPRPFCYLWVAYQSEALSNTLPVLRMYAMLFERKYSDKGINSYLNLEGEPSLKFELEMEGKNRIISLCPIVRDSNQEQTESGNKRGEDNLLLINVEGKTILFDLNQWYKEQMPRFIEECQNVNAILSSYQLESKFSREATIVSFAYIPSTLKEFSCTTLNTPEEFFFPNSLSMEWVELDIKRLTFWKTLGVQNQLLREMAIAGPIIMIQPSEIFHRCVATGLVPFSSEMSFNDSVDSQRDALLSLCLEQRWTIFLHKCIKEWSDGSAAYLYPAFLHWAIQRASTIQLTTHQLCIPLFDLSGSSIGEAEVRTLRLFSQQMECLCNVIENLPTETSNLNDQRRILRRISIYLQVLLWFYDVGLLPETQDIDEESLPVSFILNIPYPASKLASIYKEKRKQYRQNHAIKKDDEAVMFIDELITKECPAIRLQWEQESNEFNFDGHYPPPSLQSLLRSCLIDCYYSDTNEMENKHQLIIYLLMDLVMLLQGTCPGVDQLIKYPSAFKLSPSLIKLTQALWLLDHEDYQGFLDIMTGQLVSESDIKDWHHKLIMRTLLRSNQNKLALIYIRVRKPPLSSIDDQSTVISLSVEHGLVQSAFHHRPPSHYNQLLTKFFRACKAHGKLNEILHLLLDNDEEEAFIQFLNEEKCEETRLIYYLQHSRYNEANNALLDSSNVSSKRCNKPTSLSMFQAYNATLPDITRRFSKNFNRQNIAVKTESRYPRPMSDYKSCNGTQDMYENVIKKAKETYASSDKSKIPFISAPCSTLTTNFSNNESNCILFVKHVRKSTSKRSLDEVKDGDIKGDHVLETRKRQKIFDSSENFNDVTTREIGRNMMFGTPLVKRKNQINNTTNAQLETPHSILKIRQIIPDSTSLSRKVSANQDEKISEKQKKPRQIRFSISQLRINNLSNDKEVAQLDTTESVENLSVTPSNHSDDCEDDEYFSPNVNMKSLSESTVLTESSSYHSKSLSGPRPRPGLKRNSVDSSFDGTGVPLLLRCSTMITDSLPNLDKTSADISMTSDIISSTFNDVCTPKVPQNRLSLTSTSIYASTILSSDTNVESSYLGTSHDTQGSIPDQSHSFKMMTVDLSPRCHSPLRDKLNQDLNIIRNTLITHPINIIAKTNDVNIVNADNDFSGREMINATEAIANMNNQEEVEGCVKEKNFVLPSKVMNKQRILNNEYVENNQHDSTLFISHTSKDKRDQSVCITDDDTSIKPLDGCDNEVLVLNYDEDDNDDVFKSLSNSVEKDNSRMGMLPNIFEIQNNSPEKKPANAFYDEYDMTDDESSKSFDHQDEPAESLQVSFPMCDVNIADDKSNENLYSAKLSTDCVLDRKMKEHLKKATIIDTSLDGSNNEPILMNEQKIFVELRLIETNDQTSFSSTKSASKSISEEVVEASTPIRITRSRRASSVVPIIQQVHPEQLKISKIARTRRANSLSKDTTHSTQIMTIDTKLLEYENAVEYSVVKRDEDQCSTSLMKETPITSSISGSKADVPELPVRRSTRRAISIQKDAPDTSVISTKNDKLISNTSVISGNSMDGLKSLKKMARDGNATFINKNVDVKTQQTQAILASEEIDDSAVKQSKLVYPTATLLPAEIDNEVAGKNSVQFRRTRAASTSKESTDKLSVKGTKLKRTKVTSVTEGITEGASIENVSIVEHTRAASISKEHAEKSVSRKKRATSLTNDVKVEVPLRKTRAASLTKDIENNSAIPKRMTRASLLTKETCEDDETIRKRVTRRNTCIAKDSMSELLGIKKGSIVQDIIPEEDLDESIFTSKCVRVTEQVVGDSPENHSCVTRSRMISIPAIPGREKSMNEESGLSNKKAKKSTVRCRRAASVDLSQIEVKRRIRGSIKSVPNEDHNDTDEPTEIDSKSKSTRKTFAKRKVRAVSETKELSGISIVERPKRSTRVSQATAQTNDSNRLQIPKKTRSASKNTSDKLLLDIF